MTLTTLVCWGMIGFILAYRTGDNQMPDWQYKLHEGLGPEDTDYPVEETKRPFFDGPAIPIIIILLCLILGISLVFGLYFFT